MSHNVSRKRDLVELYEELKRRSVFKVLTVYTVVAWGVVQVAATVVPELGLPGWTTRLVILLAILGFPIAATLGWGFDITPDGVRRAPPTEKLSQPPARPMTARHQPTAAKRPRSAPPALPLEIVTPSSDPGQLRRAALAGIRHELRTPLNAILGYSEMLLEDAEEDAAPERLAELRQINAAGKRLLGLIDEILRPDAAAGELSEEELAAIRGRAQARLPGPVAALLADCRGALQRAESAGAALLLPDLQRVADSATRLREQIDQLGSDAPIPVAERVMARIRVATASEQAPPRHGQLLVVDDNAMNRDLLSRQLARQGYSVATASNGPEALEMLHARDFDLVLLDVLMPEMDGIEVLDRMQRDPVLAELPVIMISALDEVDGVVRCIERGAVDYLSKPFDPVLLQARIGSTLELRWLREQERRAAESLDAEVAWSGRLAASLLPAAAAEQLQQGTTHFGRFLPDVTVVAAELDGLGTLAARGGPERAVELVREVVDRFDRVSATLPVETLWLGGRSFIAVVGIGSQTDDHAARAGELALRLADELKQLGSAIEPLRAGIGIHTGAISAGLTGGERLVFGFWGEGIEVAQALARGASAAEIQLSPATYSRLFGGFELENRGVLRLDDRNQMTVYRLLRSSAAARR